MRVDRTHGTLVIRFGERFAAPEVKRVSSAVFATSSLTQLTLDFGAVQDLDLTAITPLVELLESLQSVRVAFRGLTLHQSRLFKYLGVSQGKPPQADVGRPPANLGDPFADACVLDEARAVLEDLAPRERIPKLDDESSGWQLLRALPYLSLSKAIDGVVLTFFDATEMKCAEAELRQAKERERRRAAELEAIMRSVPAAVLIAQDAAATRAVGNDAAYRLLRMSPGQNLSFLAPAAERPRHFRVVQGGRELSAEEMPLERAAASGAEIRDFEEEVHFEDGDHIHLFAQALPLRDDVGKVAGAVAAFMDVTPLKAVEQALRAAEARFRGSLEAMLDPFAMFRPVRGSEGKAVDYEIEYLNAPARAFLAVPEAESRLLRDLVAAASPLLAILDEAAERGAVVERLEESGAGVAGDARIHDLRACVLESGEVAVAWRDVTDRARATRALREADRCKDEFLAILGHELRNPLAALDTALLLERRRRSQGAIPTERHLEIMQRQVRALERLVGDLLDVTRITHGKVRLEMRAVDLTEAVRAEFEILEHASGDELQLTLRAPPGPVWVSGDRERIGQIAGNLMNNACKFSDPGGAVEVSIRAPEGGPPELVVRDEGVGMTAETQAHLFEPFRQADQSMDRARGGLGLGLSLVKGLGQLMGAEVSGRSAGPGRGSEFTVRFVPASPPAQQPRERAPDAPPRRRRILVIEDNPDVRQCLVEYLSVDLGHEVATAEDGLSGVSLAREWRPELVLCDIGLPRLDGYQVARMLRSEPALTGTVVAAMTGYGSTGDKARAGESGFDRHFTKPFEMEELRRFLDDLPDPAGEG